MEKENNLKVNFKEILSDGQQINQILNRIGQDQFETEEILSSYEKNGNRHGVIFMARATETGKMNKIIIDAIYGEANSTQVKDLTYEIGADCDKRIILYTLGHPDSIKNEYRHEYEMMKGLVSINNDCGFETFVVKVSLDSDKNYQYNAEICPDENKWTQFRKLPTKLEFEKAIFKVFYNQTDQFGGYENDHMDDIDEWFSSTGWHLHLNDIYFEYPVWTENGMFMDGVSTSEIGNMHLKWIMDNKMGLLEKFFSNREITFIKPFSGGNMVSIKLWDKPFTYFANASVEKKEGIVETLRGYDGLLFEFWQILFREERSDNVIIKDYGCIPEKAFMELDTKVSA